jgi:hypothetical protein
MAGVGGVVWCAGLLVEAQSSYGGLAPDIATTTTISSSNGDGGTRCASVS